MGQELRRTFRLPKTPWEEYWWQDEYLATGLWIAIPTAIVTFLALVFLLRFPKGGEVFLVLIPTALAYVLTLLGVAAHLRTRKV